VSETAENRGWVSRLIRAAMILVFAIALLEVLVRLFVFPDWRALSPQILKPHPVFLRFSAPDLDVRQYDPPNFDVRIQTNSMGFRDRREGFDKDLAGIWLCGGSNMFGTGVNNDETMEANVERHGFRAANIAAEGSQIEIEARVIRYLTAQGHKPRAVVCVITTPGGIYDFADRIRQFDEPLPDMDSTAKPMAKLQGAADILSYTVNSVIPITEPGTAFSILALKARMVKSSAIYGATKYGVGEIPPLYNWMMSKGYIAEADLHISGQPGLYLKDPDEASRRRITNMAAFVTRLRDFVRDELGVPFGIVLVPTQHQIYPDKFDRYTSHFGLDRDAYDLSLPNRWMAAALEENGIPVLDLRPPLLARNGEQLTFTNNGHLNPRGQEIAGEAVADWIENALGITPEATQ
jgi:hypothetical protein